MGRRIPFALAGLLLGFSFGALGRPVMGSLAAVVMSVIVFAGSAQFGALAVLRRLAGAASDPRRSSSCWWRRSAPGSCAH